MQWNSPTHFSVTVCGFITGILVILLGFSVSFSITKFLIQKSFLNILMEVSWDFINLLIQN